MEIGIAEFRSNMADPINRAAYGRERVILTRDGKPTVALVGMEDLRKLESLDGRADQKAAAKAAKEAGGAPLEKSERRLPKTKDRG